MTQQLGPLSLAEAERLHIVSILDANDWNISQTAKILEVERVLRLEVHEIASTQVQMPTVELPDQVPVAKKKKKHKQGC